MKNIAAYTAPNSGCPEYVSINETVSDDFASITVRSRGGINQAWMEIPKTDLIQLANDILAACAPAPVVADTQEPTGKKK